MRLRQPITKTRLEMVIAPTEPQALQIMPLGCEALKLFVPDILAGTYPEQLHDLANNYQSQKFLVAEEKYDGRRYLLQMNPNGSKINYLTGRRISVVTKRHTEKQDSLPFIRDYDFKSLGLSGTVLDTEVVTEGGNSGDVAHAMARGKGTMIAFDILRHNGADVTHLPLTMRREILDNIEPHFPDWLRRPRMTTGAQRGARQIRAMLREIIKLGGEGMILKDARLPYGKGWYKVITKEHHDCVITGFTMATEKKYKEKGWIKNINLGQYYVRGTEPEGADILCDVVSYKGLSLVDVGCTSGMSEAERADFTNRRRQLIGEPLEISCKERIPKTGKFRHPVFERLRPDKNAKDCVFVPSI